MKTFVFIDASNLFYGGEKILGWKIDYQKLLDYLKNKYNASKFLYFGGIEIYDFQYNYLDNETVPLSAVYKFLIEKIKNENTKLDEATLTLLSRHIKRIKFYLKLEQFGYELHLKPVKRYYQDDMIRRKANCDVDMAFHLMQQKDNFDRVIVLSGDGDFLPVLKYLKKSHKDVLILARGERTAKEIRQFAGSNFRDFEYLKYILEME